MTAVERLGESERVLRRCESALERARTAEAKKAEEHASAIVELRNAQQAHDKARLEAIAAKHAFETSTSEGPSALRDRSREVKTNGHGVT
jgi:hypothetical protein